MAATQSNLHEHLTLNLIAPALEGFTPPEAPFDPEGEWTADFGVYTLANVYDLIGKLTLSRGPAPSGGVVFSLDYENINNLRVNVGVRVKLGVLVWAHNYSPCEDGCSFARDIFQPPAKARQRLTRFTKSSRWAESWVRCKSCLESSAPRTLW